MAEEHDVKTVVDTRALEVASRAEGRIMAHENQCAERMGEIRVGMKEFRDKLDAHENKNSIRANELYKALDEMRRDQQVQNRTVLLACIGGLIAMVAYLLTNGVPWR